MTKADASALVEYFDLVAECSQTGELGLVGDQCFLGELLTDRKDIRYGRAQANVQRAIAELRKIANG